MENMFFMLLYRSFHSQRNYLRSCRGIPDWEQASRNCWYTCRDGDPAASGNWLNILR